MPETEQLAQVLEELRASPTPKPPDPFMALMERTVAEARTLRESLIPNIVVEAPEAPVVNVAAPEVRMDVPDQSAAIVALTGMIEQLASAFASKEFVVTVNVPKQPVPQVTVEMPPHVSETKTIKVKRNSNGLIESATVTEA